MSRSVLLIDDDPATWDRVTTILTRAGLKVTVATGADEAIGKLDERVHDAALLDLDLEGADGLMRRLRKRSPGTPLLVIARPERHREALRALREGAEDYVLRPPDPFELRIRLEHILERRDLDSRLALFREELSRTHGSKRLMDSSAAMRGALEKALRVAPLKTTVLVSGESGVGKELVARAIHLHSPRRDFPFIALNCAAMPSSLIESELFGHEKGSFTGAHARARGKFEIAHRGTLFLDEIGEMGLATQAKLLRVLEEREFMRVGGDQSLRVDVRVIAATNADLEALVERGSFRRDLYYRLKVVSIHVPPLRERREDIPALVEAFLEDLSRTNAVRRKTVTAGALAALEAYHWPGNVRELKNVLESLLVSTSGEVIRAEDLPPSIAPKRDAAERPDLRPGTTLTEMERELIRRTLEHTGGNRTWSAELLAIGIRTLQRKIREYGLDIPPRRRRRRLPRALAEKGS